MKDVSLSFAFLAGLLSFLSPCVFPLLPSYVSYITGISFDDLTAGTDRKRIQKLTIINSLIFISGFSTVFIILGASSSFLGQTMLKYQDLIRIIGGIIIILFGLSIAGILKLDFLMREKKIHLSGKPAGYAGTFVVGMTFAAGWTPCIGPILGAILLYASSTASTLYGIKLLAVYSLGFAVPFFVSSLAINSFLSYMKRIQRYMRAIMMLSGLLLVLFGILLLTNRLRQIIGILPDWGISL